MKGYYVRLLGERREVMRSSARYTSLKKASEAFERAKSDVKEGQELVLEQGRLLKAPSWYTCLRAYKK